MAINAVIGGDALARALRTEFINTWRARFRGLEGNLSRLMELGINSDKIEEIYGYYEKAPYPRRRPWGEEVQSKAFRARNFTVENVAWDASVEWYKHQRLFDQLRDLERAARDAGANYATLPDRILFQIYQATTDPDLLDPIPNAPDGVAIFSAVDGDGAARFGVTGGNIETGSGVGSAEAIRTNVFDLLERIASFLDPESEPVHDPVIIDQGITLMYRVANTKVVREAFIQARTVQSNAAVTNIVLDSGMQINLVGTTRITDDDIYANVDGFEVKPVFEQVAQALDEQIETEANSDRARRTKLEGIFWEAIRGYGVNLPLGIGKVNN